MLNAESRRNLYHELIELTPPIKHENADLRHAGMDFLKSLVSSLWFQVKQKNAHQLTTRNPKLETINYR
jgi:hypothetical protein